MADRRPQTRYTTIDGADVAYQVFGDGPRDSLWWFGLASNIEFASEIPATWDLSNRLTGISRVVLFDRRGSGASDATTSISTWEEWAQDIQAVIDALGSERMTLFAVFDAGPIAMLYAALHPERVDSLILFNSWARFEVADDFQIGASPDTIDLLVEIVRAGWGTTDYVRLLSPSTLDDASCERLARMMRQSATPNTAAAQCYYMFRHIDVRPALGMIQVPTLVLHSQENPLLSVEHGRYLAEHIENARLVEVPGTLTGMADNPAVMNQVVEFITGVRGRVSAERVLSTILFSDIVGSTDLAARLGDHRWRAMLDAHDRTVRDQLERYRGREVKTTGDGFVIAFDGPARAIHCASAIVRATAEHGIGVRTGLHTGECEVRGDDLGGLAVHIAARVGALAEQGEVLVSGTVKDLVIGSGIEFTDRGERELKGVPGTWKLFALRG